MDTGTRSLVVPVEATCESGKRGTPACFAGFAEGEGNEEFDGIGFWKRKNTLGLGLENLIYHTQIVI